MSCSDSSDVFAAICLHGTHVSPKFANPIDDVQQSVSLRLYKTRTHLDMFQILYSQALNLCQGKYVNTQGFCGRTVVGDSGVGKTFAMKAYATAAPQRFTSLVSIYISLNNTLTVGSALAAKSLMTVLNEELCRVQAGVETGEGLLGGRIVSTLIEKQLFVHLLVDDVDQLYRANGATTPVAVQTLHDLSYLGNQPSGRVAITLCGSPSLMQDLLDCTAATPEIQAAFPLLTTGTISLDAVKFEITRPSAMLPTDLSAVASVVERDEAPENRPYLRAVAFLSGCTARMIERLLQDGYYPVNVGSAVVSSEISTLRDKIFTKLYRKNRALCNCLFQHKTAEQAAWQVQSVDWEKRLRPLDYSEVEGIWRKMMWKGAVPEDAKGSLWRCVRRLADMSCIVIEIEGDARRAVVYPSSLLGLAAYACDGALNYEELAGRVYKVAVIGDKQQL